MPSFENDDCRCPGCGKCGAARENDQLKMLLKEATKALDAALLIMPEENVRDSVVDVDGAITPFETLQKLKDKIV